MIDFYDAIAFSDKYKRDENQDACGYMLREDKFPDLERKAAVFLVADGVSCSNGGEAARRIRSGYRGILQFLIEECMDFQEQAKAMDLCEDAFTSEIYKKLQNAVLEFDRLVRGNGNQEIGATISLALVLGCSVYTANLGDSPIFLVELDLDGAPVQLRELYRCDNAAANLPEEEALKSYLKNTLTVDVLGDAPDRDTIYVTKAGLYQNNMLLLGSDGALSVLPKHILLELIRDKREGGLEAINDALLTAIGGVEDATDNYTLVGQCIWTE